MSSTSCIGQKGIIDQLDSGIAQVRITTFSACASCQSKSACGMSESEERVMEVPAPEGEFRKGEMVDVIMQRSLGLKATLIAYVVPFIIVLIILIILNALRVSELWSGILSLTILVPYFSGLYYFRDRLKKTFTFTLRKVS